MSMSTHVVGIIPPDEKFNQMKKVWDTCEEAGISIPDEVIDFFGNERPDVKGMTFYIGEGDTGISKCGNEHEEGYEIDISKLDPKFKLIRVVNSW